ncbi:hypothetical protein J6590_030415 [Homalodisca vitripennis]|nr:hypothetical protein J6590_030415 [Homalodisca vitripennis]
MRISMRLTRFQVKTKPHIRGISEFLQHVLPGHYRNEPVPPLSCQCRPHLPHYFVLIKNARRHFVPPSPRSAELPSRDNFIRAPLSDTVWSTETKWIRFGKRAIKMQMTRLCLAYAPLVYRSGREVQATNSSSTMPVADHQQSPYCGDVINLHSLPPMILEKPWLETVALTPIIDLGRSLEPLSEGTLKDYISKIKHENSSDRMKSHCRKRDVRAGDIESEGGGRGRRWEAVNKREISKDNVAAGHCGHNNRVEGSNRRLPACRHLSISIWWLSRERDTFVRQHRD